MSLRVLRAAMALPAIRPPPPIGITNMSRSGTSSSISSAMVPWPAMMAGSSRVHQDEAMLGDDRGHPILAFAQGLADKHHPGAVGFRRLHLYEGGRDRHDDRGWHIEALRLTGDRLGVIAGRHADHAAPALLVGEGGKLDDGTAILERVGDLQVL